MYSTACSSQIDRDTINFLDIRIYRGQHNNLQTTVYRKKTATNSLLHASSQHPTKKLYERFRQRGYTHNLLKKAYKRALTTDMNSLLIAHKPNIKHNTTKQIRMIGEFSSQHKAITQILTKHWHILEQDKDLKQIIGDGPLITLRRSTNLRNQLTKSHLAPPLKSTWLTSTTQGCYNCGNCLACPFISKTKMVTGRTDISNFIIKQFINCKMTGVIYVMKCKCDLIYVGKTRREFRRRILEHVGDVRNKRNTTIANHIKEMHNGDTGYMRFFAVEHIQQTTRVGDIDRTLLQCEAKWIYWLNSKAPNGLNKGFTFSPFL
ncbi:hypothetical protein XELAEV_18005692mg [Xenopus laevis]|uniref:GIY-YIG domain-containing protein n=1 Tax=Xenopus laevis TaxID=8355 RepID=A0A974DXT7_XENLA|nr:hypothetical protein XELAEV_18005692mg [Xenopus laevis]